MSLVLFLNIIYPLLLFANDICPQKLEKSLPYNTKTHRRNIDTAVINQKSLNIYFQEVRSKEYNLPFDYVLDGCNERAFFMSKILYEKHNINTFRVSMEATSGHLLANTPKTMEGFVEVRNHAATALCVHTINGVTPYVIDPAFFREPVPLIQWQKNFIKSPFGDVPYRFRITTGFSLDPKQRKKKFTDKDVNRAEASLNEFRELLKAGKPQIGVIRGRNTAPEVNH